jgi:hypothetical protein
MLKLAAAVALFAGFCWFGTQIPLGSHTLFGHLHAIAGTRESQDLFDGTKESAKPLVDDMRRRIAGAPDPTEVARSKVQEKVAEKLAEKAGEKVVEKVVDDRSDEKSADKTHKGDSTASKVAGAPHPGTAGHKDKDKDKDEEITNAERRRLRRLISSTEGASAPR